MFVRTCTLLLWGWIAFASQAAAPKELSFSDLKKLAVSIAGSKSPGPLPTYRVEYGSLVYSLPPFSLDVPKDKPDLEASTLRSLLQARKFLVAHPKGMPKAAAEKVVEAIERKINKAFDKVREDKIEGKKLAAFLEGVEKGVNEDLQDAIGKEAERVKLKAVTLTTTVVVKVSTDPAGGRVHCITLHQKMLFEAKGMKPEDEVMKYVVSDTMSIEGKVYYVVTWEGGKKKAGPSILEIVGDKVVFK